MQDNHATCPTCHQPVEPIDILVDHTGLTISHDGKTAKLTSLEMQLFERLHQGFPGTVRKEALFDHLYQLNPNKPPEPKIVDVFIYKLRKKLEPLGLLITTAWGVGYGLEVADPRLADAFAQIDKSFRGRMFRMTEEKRAQVRDLSNRGFKMSQIAAKLRAPYGAVSRVLDEVQS